MQTKRQEVLMKKMEIKEYLKNKGITFKEVTHQAVYTVEESKKLNIHDELKGIHSKNLFLKNRKGNKFYLIILPENKKLDLELFENKLNEKLKFANEEELKKILGLNFDSPSFINQNGVTAPLVNPKISLSPYSFANFNFSFNLFSNSSKSSFLFSGNIIR